MQRHRRFFLYYLNEMIIRKTKEMMEKNPRLPETQATGITARFIDNHRPHLGHLQPGRTRSRLPRARPGRFGTRPRTRPTRPVPAGEWLTPNGATPDAPDAATAPITGRNEVVAGGPAGRVSGPSEGHR